jgi:PAS domain-containing protein
VPGLPGSSVENIELFSYPIKNGNSGEIIGVVEFVRNITERKKAEETLKSSEARLKILFEYAPDAYYLSDLKGNFLDGNKASEGILGYKKEDLIGKSFLKLKLLSVKELTKAAKLLEKKKDEATLVVSDNGIGFPDDIDFRNTETLGLQIVCDLVQQIDGKIELDKKHGTSFTVTFKP